MEVFGKPHALASFATAALEQEGGCAPQPDFEYRGKENPLTSVPDQHPFPGCAANSLASALYPLSQLTNNNRE
jgi:hypothetical protein